MIGEWWIRTVGSMVLWAVSWVPVITLGAVNIQPLLDSVTGYNLGMLLPTQGLKFGMLTWLACAGASTAFTVWRLIRTAGNP